MSAWLEQAVRAARDAADPPAADAATTRARVARTLADRARKRRARAPWIALAAALALTGTAWAAGRTYPRVLAMLEARDAEEGAATREGTSDPESHAPARRGANRTELDAPAAERETNSAQRAANGAERETNGAERETKSAQRAANGAEREAPAGTANSAERAANGAERATPPASAPSAERAAPRATSLDALYEEAHALHFVARDPARALVAWERYIARAPADARAGLVLEARYNRAICLVRLGRRDEARVALRPFADGAYGDYRRDDARALVRSLDAPSDGF